MAEFLNTEASNSALVDLINGAQRRLVLISPYVKVSERMLERLKDVSRRGAVKVVMICRREDLNPETESALSQIPGLRLGFLANLHAKCFYNDSAMVITSLNLHEHSQQKNIEMGIRLTKQLDGDTFLEALDEAEYIIRQAESVEGKADISRRESDKRDDSIGTSPSGSKREGKTVEQNGTRRHSGHCIRCGGTVPYDREAPYCPGCYRIWKKYENPEYEEEHCHGCGKPGEATTMDRPLCYSCYRKQRTNRSIAAR